MLNSFSGSDLRSADPRHRPYGRARERLIRYLLATPRRRPERGAGGARAPPSCSKPAFFRASEGA